jgi:hypothetical protein
MSLRFRKTIKLLPGVRLNLSRSGISTSIGRRGATLNIGGKRGPRATVGMPGTGLSYTERLGEPDHQPGPSDVPTGKSSLRWLGWLLAAVVVLSFLPLLFR